MRARFSDWWQTFMDYFGPRGRGRPKRIADREGLRQFLDSRASHVAQIALYGYLRTRAGARYPELFANDDFVQSINIAKWYIWLACLSDLAVYAGGLVAGRTGSARAAVKHLVEGAVDSILADTGIPVDAGPEFRTLADGLRSRLEACDWALVQDNETPFAESPAALINWAPVFDDLKRLDDEIVRNSMRFRWQEVRRDLRRDLDADLLIASEIPGSGT